MTALPDPPQAEPRLLTVAEYAALGETEFGYTELEEGHVIVSPSPVPDHSAASGSLKMQFAPQMPADLEALQEVDVNLELVPVNQPGFSRRPDLIVVDRAARMRVRAEGGMTKASEVRLVVEIISPGSKRIDNVVKHGEYADAGIPHYWIVDLDPPISLHAWHLAGEFGYQDSGTFTGRFTLLDPVKVDIDLGVLLD